ncbi:MAG TPA: acyl-CoA dehydrogenase family protein [Candidatus Margulisiibacteriota bacterium]|nr:acyl-CoA dehydrogenase family protein [Candidatus Margulisiibacteriota bacterium]
MDFGLSEEQELLQQSARDFLARECPTTFVREMMRSDDGFSRALHEKMAGMGWTGLIIPEKFGGLGMQMLDLATLAEELGRVVAPGPFFSSSVLAAMSLVHSSANALKKEWLPRIATGEAIGALAFLEESDRLDAAGITARCTKTRTGYRLQGTKMFVTDAHIADVLIVACRSRGAAESGVNLLLLPRDTPGVSVAPLHGIDQTRRPCEVILRNVEVPASALLADEGKGWNLLRRVIDAACVVLAADSLGGSQRALELAVEYSKVREQFGRPIGSFQAVKHIAAEMVSEIEPARALVWYAAYAYDHEPRAAARAASMAKARLSDVYCRTTNRAVQIHGGIGFTWEHDMHLWFKRAKWNETAFGDATFHRERLAQLAGF